MSKHHKILYLAERMVNLSLMEASESARQAVQRQLMVHEQALAAEETRQIAFRIIEVAEGNTTGSLSDDEFGTIMQDIVKSLSFLALNTAFICCKVRELHPMAVFAEEKLNIWREMSEILGNTVEYRDVPAAMPRSRIIRDVFYMFSARSGKYLWSENAHLVIEVLNYCPEYIKGNRLVIKEGRRDLDIPFINLGNVTQNAGVVIISDALDPKRLYAVLAEADVHGLVNSCVGVNKPCNADIPVRECWAASDGSEILFPDWEELSS
jgi:hypothetical protein